jgi:tumor protein p53-inducible protein 3
MRAVLLNGFGAEDVMHVGEADAPPLAANELRIAVHATAVNRADLLQRQGHYPPPPGASTILGMECAGRVAELGAAVEGWRVGDRVMALLPGGGYAEEAVVDAGAAMHVPDALSDDEAAAIPEVFLTAYLNLFMLARVQRGESALVHGGGSGVGTAATTLLKLAGARVVVTAGSAEKRARCIAHGADVAIDYHDADWAEQARGVDVILDHIGARYLLQDLAALNVDGRIVLIGTMGAQAKAEIDVSSLLMKRQQIIGSTLRGRSVAYKAAIVRSFVERFGADLEAGRVRPVIERVFTFDEAADAHRLMASNAHFGKIVLRSR